MITVTVTDVQLVGARVLVSFQCEDDVAESTESFVEVVYAQRPDEGLDPLIAKARLQLADRLGQLAEAVRQSELYLH